MKTVTSQAQSEDIDFCYNSQPLIIVVRIRKQLDQTEKQIFVLTHDIKKM